MRSLRLWKISKILRMLRVLRFFADLKLMLDCVAGSFIPLMWCFVILSFFWVVFALIFVQGMASYLIENKTGDNALKGNQLSAFGSVQLAMFTLFQAITGGNDWGQFYKMISPLGTLYAVLFAFYIIFFIFAAMNIVTSIFMDKAMRLAQPDIETLLLDKKRDDYESYRDLKALCQKKSQKYGVGDPSTITFSTFQLLMKDPKVKSYFELKGLAIKDAELFFKMLGSVSDSKSVDLDDFITGCMKMKGCALSVDLLSLSFEMKLLGKRQHLFFEEVWSRLDRVENSLQGLRSMGSPAILKAAVTTCTNSIQEVFTNFQADLVKASSLHTQTQEIIVESFQSKLFKILPDLGSSPHDGRMPEPMATQTMTPPSAEPHLESLPGTGTAPKHSNGAIAGECPPSISMQVTGLQSQQQVEDTTAVQEVDLLLLDNIHVRDPLGAHRHWALNLLRHSNCRDMKFLMHIAQVVDWWLELKEPDRNSPLANCIGSKHFEAICICVIMANSICTVVTTNHVITYLEEDRTPFIKHADTCFLCFYIFEALLKLYVHGVYYFCNDDMRWNLFDAALIGLGTSDFLLTNNAGGPRGKSGTFMRSFRLLKISKILRMLRVLRFVADLRLMIDCVAGSLLPLLWCLVILMFFWVIFALLFVQGMASYLIQNGASISDDKKKQSMEAFGSVEKAIFTLFQATTGGNDWGAFYDLVKPTGTLYAWLFIFYIAFFVFAAMNIVTSIFMDKAMRLAQPDMETLLSEKQKEDYESAHALKQLALDIDENHDQNIDFDEFKNLMANEKVRAYFELKGLQIKDAELFFRMLSQVSQSDGVDIDAFISGCMKMKGFAMSVDLLSLGFETRDLSKVQESIYKSISTKLESMAHLMGMTSSHSSKQPQGKSKSIISAAACSEMQSLAAGQGLATNEVSSPVSAEDGQLSNKAPWREKSQVDLEMSSHDVASNLPDTSEFSMTLRSGNSLVQDVQAATPLPATTTVTGSESSTTFTLGAAPSEDIIPEQRLIAQPSLEPENIALEIAGQQESTHESKLGAVTLCKFDAETAACQESMGHNLCAGLAPYAVAYDWPMYSSTWNPIAQELQGEEILLLSSNCGVGASSQEFYYSTSFHRAVERHDAVNSSEPFQIWADTLHSEVESSPAQLNDNGNWETLRTQARDAVEEAFVIAVGRSSTSAFQELQPP